MSHESTTQSFSTSSAADRELAEVLDRYLMSLEQGTPLSVDQLVADYPHLAGDIYSFVSSVDMLHAATHDLHQPPARDSRKESDDLQPRSNEKRLGDFEIGPEIGRGGMGVVYEGTQISLQRKVALKVLPFAAMWDQKQIARFQNEAQAAAQLHHPHIVPVFAVGQERGVHFYAMQLIQGRSLEQILADLRRNASERSETEQCVVSTIVADSTMHSELSSQHAAGQSRYCRAIAELGIQAANALHYAHECGVVHRDVKPSNLLVDHRNKLWITDFGLARIQDSPGVTVTGDVVGTLRYMSPEQANGKHALVDPRTDIYSLGASLYEMLTLRPAFPGEDRQAVLQAIVGEEPIPPRTIDTAIPVDLETIVLQAMAKSRDERYSSAEQLSDDLNRFLEGKPTHARRPTVVDRAGKWVRRHRVIVGLAAVFLLLLTAVSTTGALLLSREHARKLAALETAEENWQQARSVVDRFGAKLAQRLAQLPGSEPLRHEVLSDTLDYYQEFSERVASDPLLRHDLATTQLQAGTIANQLGDQEQAEKSFRNAGELFAELAMAAEKPGEFLEQQATALNNLALLYAAQGKLAESKKQFTAAIQLQSHVVSGDSENASAKRLLAELFTNRGLLERQSGELDAARKSLSHAITLLEAIVAHAPDDSATRHSLAMALNNRSILEQQHNWRTAERSCQAAVTLLTQLIEDSKDSASASLRSDLAMSYNNLAAILGHQSKDEEAIRAFEHAVSIQEQLVRQAPGVVQHRSDLAITWNNLAQARARQNKDSEATVAYERAQSLFAELVDDFPRDIRYRSSLAGVFNNRGMASELAGNLDGALQAYQQAITHQQVAVEQSPQQIQYREFLSKHYYNCGRTLRGLHRPAEAAELALERRKLWQGDGEQLFQVALELAVAAESIGEKVSTERLSRDQIIDEAIDTLQLADASGHMTNMQKVPMILRSRYQIVHKINSEVQP